MRFLSIIAGFLIWASTAQAFCGFYVAKADGSLYNESSKVVFVRDGRKSVITMSSDYRGAPKDFAMIVPTPKVLKRSDIRTVQAATVDHLDGYTAPRLVEYHDGDPCGRGLAEPSVIVGAVEESACGIFCQKTETPRRQGAKALGVTIKAEYAVGDYDIAILAAKQSEGLVTFLTSEGYKLPPGATEALGKYISNGMKFFVAKVNLQRHSAKASKDLPPLQISFRSRKFMLPIQLGKLNADKAQDALIMMLTRKGRVEVANYRARELPTDTNIPSFVEDMFPYFYRSVSNKALKNGGIAMEYAWDMQWCDPCAADPLSRDELEELGVTWLKNGGTPGQDVYVTRFHAQYTKNQMRKDFEFKVTSNRDNFQGRYVMNQPFTGDVNCPAGKKYVQRKRLQLRQEAVRLAEITGWSPRKIEARIKASVPRGYW